jgi:undecaprenyl-diphosphatase
MDFYLFKIINGFAGRWPGLDWLAVFCAKYLIFVMGLAAVAVLFFYKKEKSKDEQFILCIKMTLAVLFGYLAKIVINLINMRPRPFEIHDVQLLVGRLTDGAFPSIHTLVSFVIAFGVYAYDKKMSAYFIIAAALVSLSRVYVGVHYPFDILGGIILAWLSFYLVRKINFKKIFKI